MHQAAVTVAVTLDDPLALATALSDLGRALHRRGDHDDAVTTSAPWSCTPRRIPSPGDVRCQQGELAAAADNHTRALGLCTDLDDRGGQVYALIALGGVWYAGHVRAGNPGLRPGVGVVDGIG